MLTLTRDPRWGRGQETQGEDPTLNAAYASNFPLGFQGGEDPKHLKASCCLKHYAAYNLENFNGIDRHHFNAIVPAQDLADTYLPPFQAGVAIGRASGLMCSYNEVNGVPMCANEPLLNATIRTKWGFDGCESSPCSVYMRVRVSVRPPSSRVVFTFMHVLVRCARPVCENTPSFSRILSQM
jgi:beta-glucosidase-like glycosyl hydrolase